MTNLTAQLQAADAGSLDLDLAILKHFGFDAFVEYDMHGNRYVTTPGYKKPGHYEHGTGVSTSIDAALSLVEEVLPGWAVKIEGPKWTYLDHDKWTAMVKEPRGEPEFLTGGFEPLYPNRTIIDATHKSPAIALCLALLSAVEGGEDHG